MTGFRYLIASSMLIACATLVSANYRFFGENATMSQLFSLGALCEKESFQSFIPIKIDCNYYESVENPPAISFTNDERVKR